MFVVKSMPYNEQLAGRVRDLLSHLNNVEEKAMFGGLCFMVNGKMCIGIESERIMVRFDPQRQDEMMMKKGVSEMDFTKRVMKGYAFVSKDVINNTSDLQFWIDIALEYNPKAKSSKKKSKKQ